MIIMSGSKIWNQSWAAIFSGVTGAISSIYFLFAVGAVIVGEFIPDGTIDTLAVKKRGKSLRDCTR